LKSYIFLARPQSRLPVFQGTLRLIQI